uniref:Uncharacterized protein n=1 Tax=Oryza meridionalis TaxID=40149 RepID=A0A0E0DD23_9ORYZ
MIWDWRQALPPPHVACNPTYLLLPLYHGLGAALSSACDDLESDWEGAVIPRRYHGITPDTLRNHD